MTKIIDLRSDTVTTPTERMREAMKDAAVGDDVLYEDPTVRKLEEMGAELFGKEQGLLTVSGTMSNQVAVLSLCKKGDQIIVHDRSHMYNLEVAGLASIGGVQPRPVFALGGRYDLDELEREVFTSQIQTAPTRLICIENTFDLNRGLVIPKEHIDEVVHLAEKHNITVYMDGARVLNAAVKLNMNPAKLCEGVDALALCLSKALACPIGSLLVGSSEFIARARRMRQMLGGGWRQAGIIAAAGIVALEQMVDRLAEDHENARLLAEGLITLGLGIDSTQVQTNIIHIDLSVLGVTSVDFCSSLLEKGVKAKPVGLYEVRMITHKDFKASDIETVLDAVSMCLKESKNGPANQ